MIFGISANLSQQRAGRNGILIANEVLRHKAITFFTTADVLLLSFRLTYLVGNPFKARIAVAHLDMVLIGNLLDNFRGNDSLHNEVVWFHLTRLDAVGDDVIEEKQASLVAVDKHPFALIVLASHAHAVGIGVGCHNDIGVNLLGIA